MVDSIGSMGLMGPIKPGKPSGKGPGGRGRTTRPLAVSHVPTTGVGTSLATKPCGWVDA